MSARDIAILSRETLKKYPDILKYSSIKYLRMERDTRYVRQGYFDMHSTFASLIGWRNIDGLKTGWTPEANRCITVTAEENGRRYIVVVMGEETISQRDKKVKELLAKAFDRFHPVVAAKAGDVIDTIAIDMAKNTAAEIGPAQDVTLVISRTESVEEFETKIDILPGLKAPMKKGDLAGTLSYYRGEEKIAEVDLVLNADLEKASLLTRILRYISQLFAELADWLLGLFE
jgi:D-alanyl-D-alanine carboxypeptidase (penicillin-binding protein 5/6)